MVGCARRQERVDVLAEQLKGEKGKLYSRRCDVAEEIQIRQLFDWIEEHPDLGKVDVCINNAGLSAAETLMDGKMEDWRRMLDVNVLALCLATQLSIKSMTKHGIDDGQVSLALSTSWRTRRFRQYILERSYPSEFPGGHGELVLWASGATEPVDQVVFVFFVNQDFFIHFPQGFTQRPSLQ